VQRARFANCSVRAALASQLNVGLGSVPHGPRFSLRGAASQLVGQRLVARRELKGDRVNAVAEPRGLRVVREDVPLVAATACAEKLRPDHAVAGIPLRLEMLFIERRGEARPAGAALEFVPARNSGSPQSWHVNTPSRCSSSKPPQKAASVPW
jgi:hypothetical protein